jgi:8-oxo-dGTP pyrophosphatase MutT (NUDIX family)
MKKPEWRLRSSISVIDSPYMRLRSDEVELPDGTVVSNYYIRESNGFVIVFPVTPDRRVVLIRQYRYGSDAIHIELPAGGLDAGEDPLACAQRELLEETGYTAPRWEFIGTYVAEPVRSNAQAYMYLALDAEQTHEPRPDPTEFLEVELASLDDVRAMLRDQRIDAGHAVIAAYRGLDHLGILA